MDESLKLYCDTFEEYFPTDQIVHKMVNPLRDYEDEFIEGPIIDIGCGVSNFLIEYSKSKRDIYAIDNEKLQLERLEKRILNYTNNDVGKLIFLEKTILEDELPNEKFALIILSNILHFFNLTDCVKIIDQIKDRTSPGSLIYVSVHSSNYYMNDPENPENNDYFKHYFKQEDINSLFDSNLFERLYFADIQRIESKLDKLIVDRWIDKTLDHAGIEDEAERSAEKSEYLKDKFEADLIAIFRKKG